MTSFRAIKSAFGPGGRSSTTGLTVTVFGGHGFLGRYVLHQLGSSGTRVNLPYRGDEFEIRHVKTAFDLGQLAVLPFHPRDLNSIREAIAHSDVVVNCIGKYYETKHLVPTRRADGKLSRVNYDFTEVHASIPKAIASISKELGVPTFIHVSALSANVGSASVWSRTKAAGEDAVREAFPGAIIVRPATIFGAEDRFLNWIADTTTKLPFFPLVKAGSNLVQPVYVVDVAKALFEIIKNPEPFRGSTFEFAGPVEYTHREVAEFVQDVIMRKKICLEIPEGAAKAFGRVVEELVSPMFTTDMVAQILEDNILNPKDDVLTFKDLGIAPGRMDRHAFDYLHRFRQGGHFTLARGYH